MADSSDDSVCRSRRSMKRRRTNSAASTSPGTADDAFDLLQIPLFDDDDDEPTTPRTHRQLLEFADETDCAENVSKAKPIVHITPLQVVSGHTEADTSLVEEEEHSALTTADQAVKDAEKETLRTEATKDGWTTTCSSTVRPPKASPVPLRDFSVAMPSLDAQAVDFDALPQSIAMALAFLRCLSPREIVRDDYISNCQPLLPPPKMEHRGRRTVVLDLDETLVHCHPCLVGNGRDPDLRLKIDVVNPPLDAHVYVRPFADVLLRHAAKYVEVVIFTASAAVYADKVIDFLDPDGTLVSHRLYRQHCTEIAGGHFKDLRRLGRRKKDIVLVDNSPLALGMTPENGILCSSWFADDFQDEELRQLVPILEQCCSVPSIPDFLESRYGLASFLGRHRQAHLAATAEGRCNYVPDAAPPPSSPIPPG